MKRYFVKSLLIIFLFCCTSKINAATYPVSANTNWSVIAGGGAPTSADIIIIKNSAIVTVNIGNAVCASIQLGENTVAPVGNGTITFNAGSQLTVSGAVSLGSATRTGTIIMTAGGTLICNSMVQTGNANTAILTQGTGTIELKTNNTLPNSTSMVTYNNLTVNGGTISLGIGITISGNLVITAGTFSIGNFATTVTGTTTITGTLTIGSAAGANTFAGLITNNGTFNNSANASVIINGGITNNSTFTSGTGTYTFSINSQALSGTSAISFAGSVGITGAINITNQNNVSVSITGNLTGSVAGSTWINAANSTLNVAGTFLTTGSFTATASSNTINYNGGAAQSIKLGTYYNLKVTSGNTATFGGTTTINNDFTVASGTASLGAFSLTVVGNTNVTTVFAITSATGTKTFGNININSGGSWTSNANETYTIGGNLTMSGGSITGTGTGVYNVSGNLLITVATSNSIGAGTLSITGTTIINGSLDFTSTAGTKTFNGAVTMGSGSAWNSNAAETYTMNSTLTMSGGSITGTATGIYRVGTNLTVTASSVNSIGVGTFVISGTSAINGTLDFTSATGNKTFTGDVTIGSGGVWSSSAAETYTINSNLTMSGGTINGTATGIYNVAGNLTITAATVNVVGTGTLTVSGTTGIGAGGSINFSSSTGSKTFTGLITNAGTWTSSANSDFNMRGGITNNGTWTGGTGTYSFSTNSQTISGSSALTFNGILAITGNKTITNQTTVSVVGDLTGTVGGSTWLNDINSTLNIGGAILATGALSAIANPNTVNYNGSAAQNIKLGTYHNLTITKTGGSTGTFAGATVVNNNLTVASGIASIGAFALTVTATTSITGTLSITSATGAKSFNDIIVNSGGTWNVTTPVTFAIPGNIQNDGTFNANTGVYTLTGATKTLSGTSNLAIPNVTITGTYTNNATLFTVSTALIGAGGLTQGINSTLALGGINTVTTFTATANPNLVDYNGAAAQNVRAATYHNLSITKTLGSTGTFAGPIIVNNNLTVTSGIASVGAFALTVTGATSISGTLDITSATGAKTFNGITVNSGGTWNSSAVVAFTVNGSIQNNGTFTSNTGIYTLAGATKTLSGTSGLSISNATISGTYTNNTTFTVGSNLIGAGTLTQGIGSILNISDVCSITGLVATTVTNLVNFNGNAVQSIKAATYYNLTVAKTGGSTGIFAGNTIVNNDLTVTSGTANIPGIDLTVSGNIAITGILSISSTTGTKIFNNVTVNSAGTWNATAAEDFTINGNIQNDGTFTSNSGIYILAGTTKTLSGTTATLTIQNITVTGSYTNNITTALNVSSNLTGAGSLTQGVNSVLNIGGNNTISALIATTVTNLVNYNGAGAQSILGTTYYNLSVTKTGGSTGTFGANTTVNNNFNVVSGVADIPGFDLTIAGLTSITGTLTISNTAGTKSFANVTVNAGGLWNATVAEDILITGNVQNDGTITSNTGIYTFSGSGKTFSGTNPVTISKITVTGTYTNTATITCATALAGAGTLTQGVNSNLNLAGTDGIINLDAATNVNTVTYNGVATQSISLTRTFYNLGINNAAGVGIAADQNLKDALTLTNGNLTTTGKNFTFLSTSTLTARLAPVAGAGTIVGNIVMQRFAPGGITGWATMSAPMNATIASWTDDFPTSGFTGASGPAGGFVSIYSYNEAATGVSDNGYVAVTSSSNPITAGKGYFVFLGTGYSSTLDINIDVTGPPVIGNKSLPVTFTPSGGAAEDGWNLVANPYPSAIDWEAAAWTKTRINSTFYVYNTDIGNYATYTTGGASTNGGTRYIPSSQGFFVQANASGPVLTATENIKVSNNPTFTRMNSTNSFNSSLISFKVTSDSTSFYDETVLRFMPLATNQFDGQFDAYKLFTSQPTAPSLSTVLSSGEYTVNSLPEIGYEQIIPLRVKVGISSNTKLSWTGINNFPEGSCLVLEDTYTHILTDLKADSSYSFYIKDTTAAPRFLIRVSQPYKTEVLSDACSGVNTGQILINSSTQQNFSYTVSDSLGAIVNSANNVLTATVSNLYEGSYTVNCTSGNAMCPSANINVNISDMANIDAAFAPSTDTLYLNSSNIISFNNVSSGTSVFEWDFGDGTQSAIKDPIHIYNTAGIYQVTLVAGSYTCTDTAKVSVLVVGQSVQAVKNDVTNKEIVIGNTPSSVWIEFNDSKNSNVRIFNVAGALIADLKPNINSGNFYLNGYFPNSGIYLVQVIINGEPVSKRVSFIK